MGVCPCNKCPKRGCGKAHDTCPKYQGWVQKRAHAATRRIMQEDVTNAIVMARLRIRGKKRR